MEECKVLVSMDCIFDTVLGTVLRMDDGLVDNLLSNGYWSRNHNELSLLNPDINQTQFNELYNTRDIHTLRHSLRTEYLNVLQTYSNIAQSPDRDNPDNVEYTFTINTFPYVLTSEELTELFTVLKEILGTKRVNHIHASPEDLTLEYLNGTYNRCVFYNFYEWDLLHRAEIVATTKHLPIIIYFPFIFRPEGIEKGDYTLSSMMLKFAFSPAMTLDILPLSLMSVMMPKDDVVEEKVHENQQL